VCERERVCICACVNERKRKERVRGIRGNKRMKKNGKRE
jgi:hypothetical protein